ncbi:hypothetical protein AMV095 [Betaentomopoxvirus amoorei]|uniref:AMV095 n=1 Tax=Amsacta moorei entomopoxvirus TaxID=28321 RepID=Q9EMV4_AMEPV|nr:hypothetical protein AMV095 [Amsacta moorei entomopoxvirus]AAG02801.1 AMV095 [Amsacta moorei entomopoxvirus]
MSISFSIKSKSIISTFLLAIFIIYNDYIIIACLLISLFYFFFFIILYYLIQYNKIYLKITCTYI